MVAQQQPRSEQGIIRKRMEIVFLCFLLALGIQVARLGYLQWMRARDFAEAANRMQMRTFTVPARRGKISDRNNNPLAQDQMTQAIVINPQVVKDAAATARRLGTLLKLKPDDVTAMRDRLERARTGERKSFYCQLIRNVDRKSAKQVQDLVKLVKEEPALGGIWLEEAPSRLNPSGVDAAQLIGMVNVDGVGTEGLEARFDSYLRGRDGERRVRVSSIEQPIPESETRMVEPKDGRDIRLTIDRDMQHFVEAELDKVAQQEHPDGATAVVMEARTGEVLAMANWPRPLRSLKEANKEEGRNRAVRDLFEPGSIFKVVTAAAALEYGVDTNTYCSGSTTIGRYRISCAHGAHGAVNLRRIIEVSCNIGAATLARRVGAQRFHDFLQRFGLDTKTGIEYTGEAFLPLQDPKKWANVTTANIGFGQGIAVTSVQLAAAYAAIANDGLYVPPKLVLAAPEGALEARPARRVISVENARLLRDAMEAVVSSSAGTGGRAKIPAYTVGGKTGTAQVPEGGRYRGAFVASFAGLVPLQKPRLVILVSVFHPRVNHYGGTVAAPVFREIARQSVAYLGIPPDAPTDTRDGANPSSMRGVLRAVGEALPMIELRDLVRVVPEVRLLPGASTDGNVRITGVTHDSRAVRPGDLFCCVTGAKADGHRFLADAVARGAVAAVVEREDAAAGVPALLAQNVRLAMPLLAAAMHSYPSRRLRLVGVTGTNGKTTTTFLITAIARAAGYGTGVIGTIGARINDEELPGDRTTPEGPELQALLARMADAATERGMVVAMEASSHALAQGRTLGCEFDVGVFTNLTQDHLDYHRDMEEYFAAKALLFQEYPRRSDKRFTGILNRDDPYSRRLLEIVAGDALSYGVAGEAGPPAALQAIGVETSLTGLTFRLRSPEGEFPVRLRLGGLFNVYNSLAAMGAARALGIEWPVILEALASTPGVPGRFESVDEGQEFGVVVDYAHTPDGVENMLRAARALHPRRLLTVFGCGGDRDRTKRPIMGRLAAELADIALVTSDNPRTEEPAAIIQEILAGIPKSAPARVEAEPDRRRAIERAVALAEPGDLVVIAGKGHEDYQIFADRTIHFDDREEARKALHARLSA